MSHILQISQVFPRKPQANTHTHKYIQTHETSLYIKYIMINTFQLSALVTVDSSVYDCCVTFNHN